MWKPYLKVVAKKAGHALHILDRFHIAKHMSDAIDRVRGAEVHSLRQQGRQPVLTKTRWLLLKRPENQTRDQRARLRELMQHNLRAVRTLLLREWFDDFWHYRSIDWAGAFLDEWCVQGLDSYGCHNDNKAGNYHCHRGTCAGQTFASTAAAVKAGCKLA